MTSERTDLGTALWRYFADPAFRADHGGDVLARLAPEAPVLRRQRFFVVSGFDAVRRLAHHPDVRMALPDFPADVAARSPRFVAFFSRSLSFRDNADHGRLRAALAPAFVPAGLERVRTDVRTIVEDLLDTVTDGGDLVARLADPLPVHVTGRLLGVPRAQWPDLQAAGRGLLGVLKGAFPGTGAQPDPAWDDRGLEQLRDTARRILRGPADDAPVAVALAEAVARGEVAEDEAVDLVLLLLMTGVDTVTAAVTNAVHQLLDRPTELERLAAGAVDAGDLFDEAVRLLTPSPFGSRRVAADLRIPTQTGPVELRRDDAVLLCFAGANLDARRFPEPLAWRPGRRGATGLVYGHGTYHCLGAALARVQGQELLHALAERGVSRLDDGPVPWRAEISFRSPAVLPVRVGRRWRAVA